MASRKQRRRAASINARAPRLVRVEMPGPHHASIVRTTRRLAASACCLLVLVVSSACGGTPVSPAPDTTTPISDPAPAASLEADIAEAIEFRERYGLRADEAWVSAVADAPEAMVPAQYGIPLMPHELADLMSRRWPNSLVVQVREYGHQFPDDFAAAYISQEASGVVVEFKANLEGHRAALAALPLDGPVEVRHATWSLKDLEGFLQKVKAELAWIESTGARYVNPLVMELDNVVVIRYEGPRGLEDVIEAHFGNPSWLQAMWEGLGA